MVRINRMTKSFMIVLLAGYVSLITSCGIWSESQNRMIDSSGETTEALYVRGKVKKISFETKTILIKPNKGASLSFTFHEQTTLKGFASFEEIKKKQPVRIWYTIDGENNMAVKVEKVLELGC